MNQAQYSRLFSFLFNIANDVLVQAFEKGDYKKITLPFIVLRRLDLLLEPTKETVLNFSRAEEFKMMPEESQEQQLCQLTGYPFYNTSAFTMKMLRSETDNTRLRQNFEAYLDGFSTHVQDIISKFDLRHYVEKLSAAGRLGLLIEKMTDENINLGSAPVMETVLNEETGQEELREKLPALDNHTMGTLFEELLRKFNEDFSVTEAGELYAPRLRQPAGRLGHSAGSSDPQEPALQHLRRSLRYRRYFVDCPGAHRGTICEISQALDYRTVWSGTAAGNLCHLQGGFDAVRQCHQFYLSPEWHQPDAVCQRQHPQPRRSSGQEVPFLHLKPSLRYALESGLGGNGLRHG